MANKKHETIVKEAKAHLRAVTNEINAIKKTYNSLIRKAKKLDKEMKVFGGDNQAVIDGYKDTMYLDLLGLIEIRDSWQATLDCFTSPINKKWGKDNNE